MRRTLIVAASAMLALAAPALAADPIRGTADTDTLTGTAEADAFAKPDPARATCKAEKRGMGTKLFKQTYAAKSTSQAMKACMAKAEAPTEETTEARVNAAKTCKAERDADPAAFTEKYGSNKNKKNAFGKCVSATAKADEA